MKKDTVTLNVDTRGVAIVKLNRPEVHNAFDGPLVSDLTNILVDLGKDIKIRVIILAANGASFCAGADIKWMKKMGISSKEENLKDASDVGNLLVTLDSLPKPTISLIQGNAFGGGVGLIAATDIAIAVDSVNFAISEVRVGVIPSVISPFVINAIGQRYSGRYFLTGERFNALDALRIGLIHDVVHKDHLLERAEKFVQKILEGAPNAQLEAKKLVKFSREKTINKAMINELSKRIARIRVSDEAQEGLEAFSQKRKPNWIIH